MRRMGQLFYATKHVARTPSSAVPLRAPEGSREGSPSLLLSRTRAETTTLVFRESSQPFLARTFPCVRRAQHRPAAWPTARLDRTPRAGALLARNSRNRRQPENAHTPARAVRRAEDGRESVSYELHWKPRQWLVRRPLR